MSIFRFVVLVLFLAVTLPMPMLRLDTTSATLVQLEVPVAQAGLFGFDSVGDAFDGGGAGGSGDTHCACSHDSYVDNGGTVNGIGDENNDGAIDANDVTTDINGDGVIDGNDWAAANNDSDSIVDGGDHGTLDANGNLVTPDAVSSVSVYTDRNSAVAAGQGLVDNLGGSYEVMEVRNANTGELEGHIAVQRDSATSVASDGDNDGVIYITPGNPSSGNPERWADVSVEDVYFVDAATKERVDDEALVVGITYIPTAHYRNNGLHTTWASEGMGEFSAIPEGDLGDGRFPTVVRIDTTGESKMFETRKGLGLFKQSYNDVPLTTRQDRFSYVSGHLDNGPFSTYLAANVPVALSNTLSETDYIETYRGRTNPSSPSDTYTDANILTMAEELRDIFPNYQAYRQARNALYGWCDMSIEDLLDSTSLSSKCGTYKNIPLESSPINSFFGFGFGDSESGTHHPPEPVAGSVQALFAELSENELWGSYFMADRLLRLVTNTSLESSSGSYSFSDPVVEALYNDDVEEVVRLNYIRERTHNLYYLIGQQGNSFSHARRVARYQSEVERYLAGETGISGGWWRSVVQERSRGQMDDIVDDIRAQLPSGDLESMLSGGLFGGFTEVNIEQPGVNFSDAPEKYLFRFIAQNELTIEYDPITFDTAGIFYIDTAIDPSSKDVAVMDWYGDNGFHPCADRSGCVAERENDRGQEFNHGREPNVMQKTFRVFGVNQNRVQLDDMTVEVGEEVNTTPANATHFEVTNQSGSDITSFTYTYAINNDDKLVNEPFTTTVSPSMTRTITADKVRWTAPASPTVLPMEVCATFGTAPDTSVVCDQAQVTVIDSSTSLTPTGDAVDCLLTPAAPACISGPGTGAPSLTVTPNFLRRGDTFEVQLITGASCTVNEALRDILSFTTTSAPSNTTVTETGTAEGSATFSVSCSGFPVIEIPLNVLPSIYES